MEDDREEWPDRDYDRREQDSSLPARVVLDLLHWWRNRAGLVAKTLTVVVTAAGILATAASVGAGWAVAAGKWEGLPGRVSALETWRADSLAAFTDSAETRFNRLEEEVDTNRARLEALQGSYQDLAEALDRIEELSEANHCWIRVTAGEESRFNCSAGVEP